MDSSYFAVIFSSLRTGTDNEAYEEMSKRMVDLAREQEGFVDIESVRDSAGRGITISYWRSLEAEPIRVFRPLEISLSERHAGWSNSSSNSFGVLKLSEV